MLTAVENFQKFLLTERGASANTAMAYGHDLRQMADYFCRELGKCGRSGWVAVDEAAVAAFIGYLTAQGYSSSSIARKVVAVRRFFAFLAARGIIAKNPAASSSAPRKSVARKTLAADDVEKLSEHLKRISTPEAKRDRAIVELLWSTGMRVGELVSLDVSCLDLGRMPSAICRSGGAKPRIVPIHGPAVSALRAYLAEARRVLVFDRDETALFVNRRGQRLSRQGLWLNFRKHARAAGLRSAAAPSALRHSFASRRLGDGVSLRRVQQMLGHADALPRRRVLSLTDSVFRRQGSLETSVSRTPGSLVDSLAL